MSDFTNHGDKPIEFCGDQEGWIAVGSLTSDSPNSPCYPRAVLLGVGLGPSGKMHPSNIAAMLTVEQATDLRERLTAAMGIDRPAPTPTPAPGLDLDAVERDAARYRRLCVLGVPKATDESEMLRFTNLDAFVDNDIAAHPSRGEANAAPALIAEVRRLRAQVDADRRAYLDVCDAIARETSGPADAAAKVRALRAKLADAKRLGLEACEFIHGAIANAPDPMSRDLDDRAAIAAGHNIADRIAAALEAL